MTAPTRPAARVRPDTALVAAALCGGGAVGLAAAVDPVAGVALAVVVAATVVTVVEPGFATLVVIGLLYSNTVGIAVRFHGMPAAAAVAVPLLLLAPLVHGVVAGRTPLRTTPAGGFLVAYLVVQLASALATGGDQGAAFQEVLVYAAEGLLLFLLVVNVVRTPVMVRRATVVVVAVAAALSLASVVQAVTGTTDANYLGYAQVGLTTGPAVLDAEVPLQVADDGSGRQSGPVGEPNRYAQVLVVVVPLAWMLSRRHPEVALRVGGGVVVVLLVAAVGLTLSRGAAVAFVLVLGTAVALRAIGPTHLAVLVVGVLALLAIRPDYAERITSLSAIGGLRAEQIAEADGAVRSRHTQVLAALLAISEHPVLGVGPGMFPERYPDYAQQVGGRTRLEPRQAHNLALGIAADTGLLGFACVAGAVAVTLRRLLQVRRRLAHDAPDVAALATGYALALVAYLGAGIFLHLSYARYFWLLLALAAAVGAVRPVESRLRAGDRRQALGGRPG
jgi:putative inorganic carbon (hco3(-)) transporter